MAIALLLILLIGIVAAVSLRLSADTVGQRLWEYAASDLNCDNLEIKNKVTIKEAAISDCEQLLELEFDRDKIQTDGGISIISERHDFDDISNDSIRYLNKGDPGSLLVLSPLWGLMSFRRDPDQMVLAKFSVPDREKEIGEIVGIDEVAVFNIFDKARSENAKSQLLAVFDASPEDLRQQRSKEGAIRSLLMIATKDLIFGGLGEDRDVSGEVYRLNSEGMELFAWRYRSRVVGVDDTPIAQFSIYVFDQNGKLVATGSLRVDGPRLVAASDETIVCNAVRMLAGLLSDSSEAQ